MYFHSILLSHLLQAVVSDRVVHTPVGILDWITKKMSQADVPNTLQTQLTSNFTKRKIAAPSKKIPESSNNTSDDEDRPEYFDVCSKCDFTYDGTLDAHNNTYHRSPMLIQVDVNGMFKKLTRLLFFNL
jgi:hypothetical protein